MTSLSPIVASDSLTYTSNDSIFDISLGDARLRDLYTPLCSSKSINDAAATTAVVTAVTAVAADVPGNSTLCENNLNFSLGTSYITDTPRDEELISAFLGILYR